jgi:glycosyltransferase involved in cell wall biosynthesis
MINCIGQIFDTSGYAIHFKNLVNALNKKTDVRISVPLIPDWNRWVNDDELEMLKRKPTDDEINLIVTHPVYWRLNLGKGRNWVFLVWEGDRIPKYFIDECLNEKIEYILVPSNHTKDAVLNTIKGTPYLTKILDKIKIIPHGVNLDLFHPMPKPKKHTFLVNKGWRNLEDRGGTQYAIKAFLEEFSDKDDVEMIIKINPVYGVPDINSLIEKLTDKRDNLPKLLIDITNYDYKDMVKLYNRGTVFVAPTRAEAYHLGIIEAMACGLPVITTNFGGQTDYVKENGWLIGGKLNEIKHEIQYEGIKWLTPDVDELKKAMRESYENKELCRNKGNISLKEAFNNTWDITAEKLMELK